MSFVWDLASIMRMGRLYRRVSISPVAYDTYKNLPGLRRILADDFISDASSLGLVPHYEDLVFTEEASNDDVLFKGGQIRVNWAPATKEVELRIAGGPLAHMDGSRISLNIPIGRPWLVPIMQREQVIKEDLLPSEERITTTSVIIELIGWKEVERVWVYGPVS